MDFVVKAKITLHPAAVNFASWLSQANRAINPWLYILLDVKINSAFRRMIRGHIAMCRGSNNTNQSTTVVSLLSIAIFYDTVV